MADCACLRVSVCACLSAHVCLRLAVCAWLSAHGCLRMFICTCLSPHGCLCMAVCAWLFAHVCPADRSSGINFRFLSFVFFVAFITFFLMWENGQKSTLVMNTCNKTPYNILWAEFQTDQLVFLDRGGGLRFFL